VTMDTGAERIKVSEPMKIIDAVLEAEGRLRLAGITDMARLEAEVLLAGLLTIGRTELIASYPDELSGINRSEYFSNVSRRVRGEPVAYITGKKEFMGLDFAIDSRALIPRPETETLVEHVITLAQEGRCKSDTILEIGTGSGCIAISLAHYLPDTSIYATDISRDAIELARYNACIHRVDRRITFCEGNAYSALPQSVKGTIDIIVSNPPYVSESEYLELDRSIREFEPPLALKGGIDGLDVIRRIAAGAAEILSDNGLLAIEIGATQAKAVAEIVESTRSIEDLEIVYDLSERPRIMVGRKNERKR